MPTSERPGVTVQQVLTTSSTTPAASSLPACVVGPCYQIVEPLDADGALNSASQVILAARLVSDTTLVEPVACAEKNLRLVIGTNDPVDIALPYSPTGLLSFTNIAQSINKRISGATASFVDDRLTIITNNKGATARIVVMATANDAYTALGLTAGTEVLGKNGYDNLDTTITYSSLPATKTEVENLSIDENELSIYKYYNNVLTQISDKSAVNQNSYMRGIINTDKNVALGAESSASYEPLLQTRASLTAKRIAGSKSNVLYSSGTEASCKIPLGHSFGPTGVRFPDPTWQNYLSVQAVGLQYVRTGASSVPGNFIGNTGNTIRVVIQDGLGLALNWVSPVLTITIVQGTTTFLDLANYLDAHLSTALGGSQVDIEVSLVYRAADAGTLVGGGYNFATPVNVYCTGGMDPVNFLDTYGSVTTSKATITGCSKVTGAVTADDLGVVGETMYFSIDGGPFAPVTFATGDVVTAAIHSGIAAVYPNPVGGDYASSVSTLKMQGTAGLDNSQGVLRITARDNDLTGVSALQESTIQVKADNASVIQKLFAGGSTWTETGKPTGAITASVEMARTSGTDFNVLTQGDFEKALVPGTTTIKLNSAKVQAGFVFVPDQALCGGLGAVDLKYNVGAGDVTIALAGGYAGGLYSNFLIDLKAKLDAAGDLSLTRATINGSDCLILTDKSGGGQLAMSSASHATVKAALNNGGDDAFNDAALVSVAANMVVKDNGTSYAGKVASISNNLSNLWLARGYNGVGAGVSYFDATDTTVLTDLLLDTLEIDYSTGAITLSAAPSDNAAPAASVAKLVAGVTTYDITYTRMWPHAFGPTVKDYSRVFHGPNSVAAVGDKVYNNGVLLGRITAIEALPLGGSYAGAQIKLTNQAVSAYASLSDWYISAESLDTSVRTIDPEVVINSVDQTISLKSALNRNKAGIASSASVTPLYAGYKALRLDVSANTANPALLLFSRDTEVETLIGPISPDNPLAFGLSKAFENAPERIVAALGVDDVTADAPEGTPEAYQRAFEFLELSDVYHIAPMTHSRAVADLLETHVDAMSEAEGKKERVCSICPVLPTEKESTAVISGNMQLSAEGPSTYKLTFTDESKDVISAFSDVQATDANGNAVVVGVGTDLSAEQGVYVDRAGDGYKYLVTKIVSSTEILIDTAYAFGPGSGPGTGGNDDSYFKSNDSALASFEADGESCTIFVRQAAISLTTTTGRMQAMTALSEYAAGIKNRRVSVLQPATMGALVNGQEQVVEGYYLSAALAGMTAYYPPQKGFTQMPIKGFTRPIGSNGKFTEKEMATAAYGGVNWYIQDVANGPVFSRHQLTSDNTSIVTKEYSVTKSIDFCAKTLRESVKGEVGPNNINEKVLEAVAFKVNAVCGALSGTVVERLTLSKIYQDTGSDTVILEMSVVPYRPLNAIKFIIVV